MKKVLIAILCIGFALSLAFPARAQTTTPAAQINAQVQQLVSQIQGTLNGLITQLDNYTVADFNAAIADAQAHNDTVGVTCWTTLKGLVPPTIPTGAGLAFYKQVYMDLSGQYINVNQNCSRTAPALVRIFDQVMQQIQALNL